MINNKIQQLVDNGTLASYTYTKVDENGIPEQESKSRNTEALVLKFPNGEVLKLSTFCSGFSENTILVIE